MKRFVLLYIPVLHAGYKQFIDMYKETSAIYIFGEDIIAEFDYLSKEIRALKPKLIKDALDAWGYSNVKVLNKASISKLNNKNNEIVVPDEDVTRQLIEKYLPDVSITYNNIFLRWDRHNSTVNKPVEINQEISKDEFDRTMLSSAIAQSKKSSDWWRHVGAVVIKGKKIILSAHNNHVPSPHTPYVNGDPRNAFHKGVNIDLSTAIHAEASIISQAAQKGISLKGLNMYVSTFPCPSCAKLIAYTGIKKLYYSGGYGVLDADSILKSQKVEIIYVDME